MLFVSGIAFSNGIDRVLEFSIPNRERIVLMYYSSVSTIPGDGYVICRATRNMDSPGPEMTDAVFRSLMSKVRCGAPAGNWNCLQVKWNITFKLPVNKHAGLLVWYGKVFGGQEFSEKKRPFVRRLPRSIYISVKFPCFVSVTEPWWGSPVNPFHLTIKEDRFDIELR